MIYTANTKKALKICFEAHKEQSDKTGMPYVFHPFHLAEQMKDETTTIVALLHDVVEDTEITLDDLRNEGFNSEVIDALTLLTHDPAIPYMDYVEKIKTNHVAKAVKLADLAHNSDMTRFDTITDFDIKRNEKYKEAIKRLNGEQEGKG